MTDSGDLVAQYRDLDEDAPKVANPWPNIRNRSRAGLYYDTWRLVHATVRQRCLAERVAADEYGRRVHEASSILRDLQHAINPLSGGEPFMPKKDREWVDHFFWKTKWAPEWADGRMTEHYREGFNVEKDVVSLNAYRFEAAVAKYLQTPWMHCDYIDWALLSASLFQLWKSQQHSHFGKRLFMTELERTVLDWVPGTKAWTIKKEVSRSLWNVLLFLLLPPAIIYAYWRGYEWPAIGAGALWLSILVMKALE